MCMQVPTNASSCNSSFEFTEGDEEESRLKAKISQNCEASEVMVDEGLLSDFKAICGNLPDVLKLNQNDSFFNIVWQQQMQAAAKKDSRTMRWHPLMIRWCLSLRHTKQT